MFFYKARFYIFTILLNIILTSNLFARLIKSRNCILNYRNIDIGNFVISVNLDGSKFKSIDIPTKLATTPWETGVRVEYSKKLKVVRIELLEKEDYGWFTIGSKSWSKKDFMKSPKIEFDSTNWAFRHGTRDYIKVVCN